MRPDVANKHIAKGRSAMTLAQAITPRVTGGRRNVPCKDKRFR